MDNKGDSLPVSERDRRVVEGGFDAVVYAHGICYASVCAVTEDAASRAVNLRWPTGLGHPWTVADEPFRTGEPNPSPCADEPTRSHWLFSC